MIINRLIFILLLSSFSTTTNAESFKQIPLQYIVALGDPNATAGDTAQEWGLWRQDPGPRGCLLDNYQQLKSTGVGPTQWKYDANDWWLEEHGVIMEKPEFPLPVGKYVVTGGREVTTVLTVLPADKDGKQQWTLDGGAKLYDVTHLPCHAARYKPTKENASCTPENVNKNHFPVAPGTEMPAVEGCTKKDYAVLFVIGIEDKN